jgi:hypothetical protein
MLPRTATCNRDHLPGARRHTLALGALAALYAGPVAAQPADQQGVRAAIEQYFRGHATAQPEEMRKAFLPTAHIEGIRSGQFTSWTADEYSSRFTGSPAADETARQRTIDRIEISGTAAIASATLIHGTTTFTDYFVLLKVDGGWRIANKVYSSRPTSSSSGPSGRDKH